MTDTVHTASVPTPVGDLRLAVAISSGEERLIALTFADHFERVVAPVRERVPGDWDEGETATTDAVRRYVAGDLAALDGVVVDAGPVSPFRQRVWDALREIPAGTTWSYRQLAERVGTAGAVRAVGSANGANPVWVVVPCHRVVRSDGSLGGYGGGVERKAWLLAHEGARPAGVAGHTCGEPGVAARSLGWFRTTREGHSCT